MNDNNGMKWSWEETILAFDLYCRTPFGAIGQGNPEIVELARLIGRTPGAVSLKMSNIASIDPELQKRGIKGMQHGSKLDEEIFAEFSENLEELSYQAQVIRAKLEDKSVSDIIDLEEIKDMPAGEYRERTMKTRVGQYFFRLTVLNSYGNCCCVTGLAKPELLVASHIKPWSVSDEKTERTNPKNGLCLNPIHDKAFDKGFITIDENYRIVISQRIKDVEMDSATRKWFMGYENQQIKLPEKFRPGKDFIQYHNDMIFQW